MDYDIGVRYLVSTLRNQEAYLPGYKIRSLSLPLCDFVVKKSSVMFTPVSTMDVLPKEQLTRFGPSPKTIWDRAAEKIRVDKDGWWWEGTIGGDGYGKLLIGSRATKRSTFQAHRVVWTLLRGPIPEGLDLDHLCRQRNCVWPEHLEPVSRKENLRRGEGFPGVRARQTHCINGHAFDEANTYIAPNGTRKCRKCSNERRKNYPRYPKRAGY